MEHQLPAQRNQVSHQSCVALLFEKQRNLSWQSHQLGDCLTQVWLLLIMLGVVAPLLPITTAKGVLSVLRLVDSAIELTSIQQ